MSANGMIPFPFLKKNENKRQRLKIEKNNGNESIIVLPEGDGFYYLNLDKKESSEEKRLSIKYLYNG